ncbi:Retrovirus-related Pol polyprotein from transposon 17.6 [Trichinella sp. T9]|nr:Retrovirus-related Pol polyprotein from transposon 17.6 [Trichinella sp. T9]
MERTLSGLVGNSCLIKPGKCQLIKKQVVYLRHVITSAGIGTDPQKTAAVQQCRITHYVRKVRQFLGLSSYYQRFIKGFARVAGPLHELTQKGQEWHRGPCQEGAFKTLKNLLMSTLILRHPDLSFWEGDASVGRGREAVLSVFCTDRSSRTHGPQLGEEWRKVWRRSGNGSTGRNSENTQKIGVAYVTPMPLRKRLRRGKFSQMARGIPMPDMEATAIARHLANGIFCRFRAPKIIHSDQGRNFESTLIKGLCKFFRTTKTHVLAAMAIELGDCDEYIDRVSISSVANLKGNHNKRPVSTSDNFNRCWKPGKSDARQPKLGRPIPGVEATGRLHILSTARVQQGRKRQPPPRLKDVVLTRTQPEDTSSQRKGGWSQAEDTTVQRKPPIDDGPSSPSPPEKAARYTLQ